MAGTKASLGVQLPAPGWLGVPPAAWLALVLAACQPGIEVRRPMTLEGLERVLREQASELEGGNGIWEFSYHGVRLACVTDERFDRMRIIAPIVSADEMTEAQRRRVMQANYHSALDARYANSGGVLYGAFIHPLSSLTESELRSAISQVANLVSTYGSAYSSGELRYGLPDVEH